MGYLLTRLLLFRASVTLLFNGGVVTSFDSASHELFQASQHRAYEGQCIAILKATGAGPITLHAVAAGLGEGTLMLEAKQ